MNGCCIYRTTQEICLNPTYPYCSKHSNVKNVVFNYCYILFGDRKSLHYYDIIRLYSMIMLDYRSYVKTNQIIGTLISRRKAELFPIAISAGFKISKKSVKARVIPSLYERLYLIYILSRNKTIKRIFKKLWKMWKKYLDRISGKDLGCPHNTMDIFTLDQLDDIQYVFCFKDEDSFVYGFEAIYLYKYLRTLSDNNELLSNPYNRNPLHKYTYIRLCRYLNIKNIIGSLIEDDRSKWITPEMAYTDVVIMFQQKGFYSSIDWFIRMGYDEIMSVINRLRDYSIAFNYNIIPIVEQIIPNEHPEYVYSFCSLCMELLRGNDFGQVTILFKSLVDKIKLFRTNAPSWIMNVQV